MAQKATNKPEYNSSVADLCDWSPGLKVQSMTPADVAANEEIFGLPGGPLFKRTATRVKSGYPVSSNTMGRMFAKIKTNTTKGEKSIITGIHKNRKDLNLHHQDSCANIINANMILSHKEAWKWDCSKEQVQFDSPSNHKGFKNNGSAVSKLHVNTVSPWITQNLARLDHQNTKSVKSSVQPNQYVITKRGHRMPPLKSGSGSSYVQKIQKTSVIDKQVVWQKIMMDIYLPKAEAVASNHQSARMEKNYESEEANMPGLMASPISRSSMSRSHFTNENETEDEELCSELRVPSSRASSRSISRTSAKNSRPYTPTPNGMKSLQVQIISPWVRDENDCNYAPSKTMEERKDNIKKLQRHDYMAKSTNKTAGTDSRNTSATSIRSLHTLHIS